MITLSTNRLCFAGTSAEIKEWKVHFQTPFGVCATLAEAVERVRGADIDPDVCVVPVVVAYDAEGRYEVVNR